ncbi:MAG: 2-amino-4-hydroxy-6-hydroxymethyldihydropteridine diphosphokinase [bacterium]
MLSLNPEDRVALAARTRTPPGRTLVYLAFGANLGDRARTLDLAAAQLESTGAIQIRNVSSFYETEPLAEECPGSAVPTPWYLNRVLEADSDLAPEELLLRTQAVEIALGRDAARERWAPREIDIDILLHGATVLRTERLTIPHPGLTARRFVLEPLAEIAPALLIPGTGLTVAQHLNALTDPLRVLLYARRGPGERG